MHGYGENPRVAESANFYSAMHFVANPDKYMVERFKDIRVAKVPPRMITVAPNQLDALDTPSTMKVLKFSTTRHE